MEYAESSNRVEHVERVETDLHVSTCSAWLNKYGAAICAVMAVAALVAYAVTLPFGAVTWYDNVVISEIARGGITHKALDWSVVATGNAAADSQSWATYYIGGWLTECAYQLGGWMAPKALLLVIYVLTAALLFFYARRRSGSVPFAAALSLFFFVFPRVAYGVKSGRVDMVALFFVFAALALLVWARGMRYRMAALFISGALGACSVFTWMTAVIALPALAWEVDDVVRASSRSWRLRFYGYGVSVAGFLLAAFLLALPFLMDWGTTLEGLKANLAYNLQGRSGDKMAQLMVYFKSLVALPGFFLLGAVAIFSRRRFWILGIGFVIFSVFTALTKAGTARMIYFIPSMVVALSALVGEQEMRRTVLARLCMAALGIVMILSYVRMVALRTAEDFRYRDRRDVAAVQEELESVIGRNASVYTDTFQAYYIGRDLGWKQYRVGSVKGLDPMPYLAKCDWYLNGWCELDGVTEEQLVAAGFRFEKVICSRGEDEKVSAQKYGPYKVYRKVRELRVKELR
jgi:MFS family permease